MKAKRIALRILTGLVLFILTIALFTVIDKYATLLDADIHALGSLVVVLVHAALQYSRDGKYIKVASKTIQLKTAIILSLSFAAILWMFYSIFGNMYGQWRITSYSFLELKGTYPAIRPDIILSLSILIAISYYILSSFFDRSLWKMRAKRTIYFVVLVCHLVLIGDFVIKKGPNNGHDHGDGVMYLKRDHGGRGYIYYRFLWFEGSQR